MRLTQTEHLGALLAVLKVRQGSEGPHFLFHTSSVGLPISSPLFS